MVKKDYVLLAQALKASKPSHASKSEQRVANEQWQMTVREIAKSLQQNGAFDYSRFCNACED